MMLQKLINMIVLGDLGKKILDYVLLINYRTGKNSSLKKI